MERIRDSVRASCSSSFNSSTGLSFKRRPTCQANEEDWQADLLKDTSALPDRAARKEIERQRLRKLLNQGKKKRRRLNGNKLLTSPRNGVDDFHCHSREPHVPRKSRSVGYRRKGKSWRSIGLIAQLQLPMPSASTAPLSFQNEMEIEFEVAEVLSGLKKQVSSSDESLIDDLEKIRVENEDNQSISVHGCGVDQASKYVDTVKSESISVTTHLEIQNHEKANLTSQVIPTPMEETESKQPDKFIIDLNEPPPMESSLEGDGMERLTPDPKVVFNEEVKSVYEEASIRRFVLPYKMEIKGELQDLNLRSPDDTTSQKQQKAYSYTSTGSDLLCPTRIISANPPQGFSLCGNLNSIKDGAQDFEFYSNNTKQENYSRPASTLKITHEHASHQILEPLQPGRIKVGPLIFPLSQNQNQTVMANHQSGLSRTGNVRFSYPIGAPFLSVLPRNVCTTNPSYEGKRLHSSRGKNAQPVPFLDEQLHPQRIFLPIQIQHQKQAISSVADIRTFPQSLYPPHSPNVTSMPSATSSFSFASSTESPFHLSQNPEVFPSFLDKTNLGSQILPADLGLQRRNSEMIQKINQADSSLAAGRSPSRIKQSGFILKSRSTSPAAMGTKVFDTSVTTPNCKLSAAKLNALSSKIHHSNSNPLGASVQLKNQQQLQAMAASQLKRIPTVNNQHQPPIAAKVSNDFSIFSGNLYDRSSTLHNPSQQKLTIPNSQPLT